MFWTQITGSIQTSWTSSAPEIIDGDYLTCIELHFQIQLMSSVVSVLAVPFVGWHRKPKFSRYRISSLPALDREIWASIGVEFVASVAGISSVYLKCRISTLPIYFRHVRNLLTAFAEPTFFPKLLSINFYCVVFLQLKISKWSQFVTFFAYQFVLSLPLHFLPFLDDLWLFWYKVFKWSGLIIHLSIGLNESKTAKPSGQLRSANFLPVGRWIHKTSLR